MPLRDHFRPPVTRFRTWEEFHGQWPGELVRYLMANLPSPYIAGATVHVGPRIEIDIGTCELDEAPEWLASPPDGAVATLPYIPAKPSSAVEFDDIDSYEVRVYDTDSGRNLVAAIEIVSPANKDRADHRQAFVAKCQALLLGGVSVIIVDIVTAREGNLFYQLNSTMGLPVAAEEPTGPYAVACRSVPSRSRRQLQAWEVPLAVGGRLPVLPLWLSDMLALELDFETSYEETCRILRIA